MSSRSKMSIFILLIFALMLSAFGLDLGGMMPEMELEEFGSEKNEPSKEQLQSLASDGRSIISYLIWKNRPDEMVTGLRL